MKEKKYKITGKGICPRCDGLTEERQHIALTDKQLRQPFFYSKWWYCKNRDCKTTMVMREEDRIWNRNSAAKQLNLLQEDKQNQQRILNL